MIWLSILLIIVSLVFGVHVHICAVSGRDSAAKIFAEFLLSMILMGAGAFLGIVSKSLLTLAEMMPFFFVYFLLSLIAAMAMTFTTHIMTKVEQKVIERLLEEQKCDGCVNCFVDKIHSLSRAMFYKDKS